MTNDEILNRDETYAQLEDHFGIVIHQLEGYINADGFGILTISNPALRNRIARVEVEFNMLTGELIDGEILKKF